MICDIDYYKKGKDIHIDVSYFDKNGKIQISKNNLGSYFDTYRVCEKTNPQKIEGLLNWDGKNVKKAKIDKLTRFDILDYISNLSDSNVFKEFNFPNVSAFDIETEVIDGFPNVEVAKERITIISYVNGDVCFVLGWKELSKEQQSELKNIVTEYLSKFGKWKIIYKKYNSEEDMLNDFLTIIVKNSDLMTGWNIFGFDWKYILKRCEVLGIDPRKSSKSFKLTGEEKTPVHTGMVDYLPIYQKYDRTVKVKESNSLDYVSEQVLGITKLKYDGTLQEMFENDFVKYCAYNAIDSILVLLIHQKIKTLYPPLMLANDNYLPLGKASSAVNLGNNLLWQGFKKRGYLVVDEFRERHKQTYEGAYIKNPQPGLYEMLACFDFASLYPSTMRLCNISPETFVGKYSENSEIHKKYKEDKDYIVTSSGSVFRGKETSVLKEILDELYAARRHYKDRYLEIKDFLGKHGIIL